MGIKIEVNFDIDNGHKSNELLANLSEVLSTNQGKEIEIDFSKVTFIAANQFAVLGALFEEISYTNNTKLYLSNISTKVKNVMSKNGFGKHLGYEEKKDKFHTTIPHRCFSIDESMEFEKYLLLNIFQRTDIPIMSDAAKNTIIDNFLEIFNNVKEHADATRIYACGQFFPKSKMLYFTIVDVGKTIKENVQDYLSSMSIEMTEKFCIEWALKEGNTTRIKNSPGGLGLSMISQFIKLNKGVLMVMSDNEVYDFTKGKSRFFTSEHRFQGTIVTIAINMNDSFSYLAIGNSIEQICF